MEVLHCKGIIWQMVLRLNHRSEESRESLAYPKRIGEIKSKARSRLMPPLRMALASPVFLTFSSLGHRVPTPTCCLSLCQKLSSLTCFYHVNSYKEERAFEGVTLMRRSLCAITYWLCSRTRRIWCVLYVSNAWQSVTLNANASGNVTRYQNSYKNQSFS